MRGSFGKRRKTNSARVRQSFRGRASYLLEIPEPKPYEFTNHVAGLCATRGTDVFRLGNKLGIDPMELLQISSSRSSTPQLPLDQIRRSCLEVAPQKRSGASADN
jgi:hypothetical protein